MGQTGKVIKVFEKKVIGKIKILKILKIYMYMCMCICKCECPQSSEIAYWFSGVGAVGAHEPLSVVAGFPWQSSARAVSFKTKLPLQSH